MRYFFTFTFCLLCLYTLKSQSSVKTFFLNDTLSKIDLSDIELIKFKKQKLDHTNFDWTSDSCMTWNLSAEEILLILKLSENIKPIDIQYMFDVVECSYQGVVKVDSLNYKFEINGGAFIYLYHDENIYYLGCVNEKCQKYFITKGGILEEPPSDTHQNR